jgi:hypothetical protein
MRKFVFLLLALAGALVGPVAPEAECYDISMITHVDDEFIELAEEQMGPLYPNWCCFDNELSESYHTTSSVGFSCCGSFALTCHTDTEVGTVMANPEATEFEMNNKDAQGRYIKSNVVRENFTRTVCHCSFSPSLTCSISQWGTVFADYECGACP